MKTFVSWSAAMAVLAVSGFVFIPDVSASGAVSVNAQRKCEAFQTGDQLLADFVGTKIPVIQAPWIKGTMTPGSTLTACSGKWKPMPNTIQYKWYRVNPDGTGRKVVSGRGDRLTYRPTRQDRCIQLVVTVTRNGYIETDTPSAIRCLT